MYIHIEQNRYIAQNMLNKFGGKMPHLQRPPFFPSEVSAPPAGSRPCCWPLPLSSPASQRPGPAKLRSSGHRCCKCYGPCRSNESLSGQRLGKAWCVGWLVGLGWGRLVGWLVGESAFTYEYSFWQWSHPSGKILKAFLIFLR